MSDTTSSSTTSSIQDIDYTEWTEIDVDQFTSNVTKDDETHTVTGTGLFDTLMETATKHLVAQYEGNRIRNEDYADAYVTIYQTTLQTCADLWSKKAMEKANLQLTLAQCELAYAQAEEARLKPLLLQAQIALAEAQVRIAEIQLEIAEMQLEQEKEKVTLIHGQTVQALAQAELANAQTKTELVKPDQLMAQTELIKTQSAQAATEINRVTAQTGLVQAQTDSERIKPLQLEAQLRLIEAQIELAKQQANSELAKRDLYRRQIEGFDEDYKQKILKIAMDSWAVGFSVAKDSFEADGIPAPMQKTTIDDLYNDYILTDLDSYTYTRTSDVLNGFDSD